METGWATCWSEPNNGEGANNGGAVYLVTGPISGTISLADAHAKAIGTHENMSAGYGIDGAGDVDADGHPDVIVGAARFTMENPSDERGSAYLIYGPMSGTLNLDEAGASFLGENSWDRFGSAVLGAGDLDDDGFDDLAIAAIGYPSESYKGAVFIWGGGAASGSVR